MRICAVPLCSGNDVLHKIPKNLELRNIWLNFCGKDLTTRVKEIFVCTKHFEATDYVVHRVSVDGRKGWKTLSNKGEEMESSKRYFSMIIIDLFQLFLL